MSGSTARTSVPAPTSTVSFLQRCRELTATSLRTAAFWGAVLMPAVYIAALYDGVAGQQPGLFLALLVANVVCVVIGQDYSPSQ